MRFGPLEIALILIIVLIVFGAGKLPEVGGAMGRAIRQFRKGQQGDYDKENDSTKSASEAKEVTGRKEEK